MNGILCVFGTLKSRHLCMCGDGVGICIVCHWYWGWDMQKWAFVYLGHTTSTRARKNAQFKLRTNKSSSLLVHAGSLNVGVKGDYAKQGVVGASRKDSNVPAHVFAMGIAPKIKTTVNEFTVLHINDYLIKN